MMIDTKILSDQQVRDLVVQLEKVLKDRGREVELREQIKRSKENIRTAETQLAEVTGEKVIPDPASEPGGVGAIGAQSEPWYQPSPEQPGWAKGSIARYRGGYWESLEDNNRYSPAAYPQGWKLVGSWS